MNRKSFTEEERRKIFRSDDYSCQACGYHRQYKNLEMDHIVPISRGGSNDPDNLQTLCWECNREKADMTMDEYMLWRDEVIEDEAESGSPLLTGIGGAAIGYAIAGPVGAVIGGLLGYNLGSND